MPTFPSSLLSASLKKTEAESSISCWLARFSRIQTGGQVTSTINQTMIRKMPGAYSDHLWIPAASISILRDSCRADFSEAAHFYAYYFKDSIERIAMMFELDESKEGPSAVEEVRLLDTLIPTFEDENERICFEGWIKTNWDAFLDRCGRQTRLRRVPSRLSGSTNRYESIERHAKESATLVDLLEEYREHMRSGDM